jgi:hypothetical protein
MGVKFGGFSIAAYRNDWLEPQLDHLQKVLDERYEELHKFVVVRDPIERCVSSYLHVVNNKTDAQWSVVQPHVERTLGKHDLTFRQWVDYLSRIDLDTSHIIWRRQSALTCWKRGVNDVVRLEEMNDYLLEMNRRFRLVAKPTFNSVTVPLKEKVRFSRSWFSPRPFFGDIPFHELVKYKGKAYFEKFPDYSYFYDKQLRRIVRELYRDDAAICKSQSSSRNPGY